MWIDFPGSRCYKMFYILFKQIVFREIIMDLSMTDFSFFGSYMSLAYESDDSGRNRWLCLKSLHGVSKARMKSMKIVPVYKGKPEILRRCLLPGSPCL